MMPGILDVLRWGLAVVLLLASGGLVYYLLVINFPWGNNVVHAEARPLPLFNASEAEVCLLAKLGFNGLGILEFRYFWRPKTPIALWYYTDGDATTCAEIGSHPFNPNRPLVRLFSWFSDEALVETFYDYGETIDQPDYNARFAARDLARACESHRARVAMFAAQHGAPLVFHDIHQLVPYDVVEARRIRQRRLRRTTRTGLWLLLLALTAAAAALFADLVLLGSAVIVCFVLMALLLRAFRYPAGALDSEA